MMMTGVGRYSQEGNTHHDTARGEYLTARYMYMYTCIIYVLLLIVRGNDKQPAHTVEV